MPKLAYADCKQEYRRVEKYETCLHRCRENREFGLYLSKHCINGCCGTGKSQAFPQSIGLGNSFGLSLIPHFGVLIFFFTPDEVPFLTVMDEIQ